AAPEELVLSQDVIAAVGVVVEHDRHPTADLVRADEVRGNWLDPVQVEDQLLQEVSVARLSADGARGDRPRAIRQVPQELIERVVPRRLLLGHPFLRKPAAPLYRREVGLTVLESRCYPCTRLEPFPIESVGRGRKRRWA